VSRRLVDTIVRKPPLPADPRQRAHKLVESEWIVTNGIGGYASSSLAWSNTRRYHGILVSALPNPLGRMVMLNCLHETITVASASILVDRAHAAHVVRDFRLEMGLPVWELGVDGAVIEKRVWMPHGQNTTLLQYRLLEGRSASIELRPGLHFRGYESAVDSNPPSTYEVITRNGFLEVGGVDGLPRLHLHLENGAGDFVTDEQRLAEMDYPVEVARGFPARGEAWSPGFFRAELRADTPVVLIASTEREDEIAALPSADARACEHERRRRLARAADARAQDPVGLELVLAADQFIITPAGRLADATRAKAMGDEIRTVIAGYHWFTDWGRDTMISLEGLTLTTGRHREAAFILRTFAHYVKDGLIPNMFPDGSNHGLYHTADATLWFFHALERYLAATRDEDMLTELLPTMQGIIEAHEQGTKFGIRMDPVDSLLTQGAEGYQLTWMDAKVDGWVVTPRRGKAVEINALWHNALCNTARWTSAVRGSPSAARYADRARKVRESFNARFWNERRGFLYDVIDGPSTSSGQASDGVSDLCRPNQVLAISLENPVLARERWPAVMEAVTQKLLTPVGLRSLAPGEPDYKSKYFGDLRTRDAAYHQGTVWGWLIGPYVDAWLKLNPGETARARELLTGLVQHLDEFGIGSVAEIFDATEPYTPRGCIAQAWSVAELLRCWALTA
jgi:predicted glycogen debranching enzyme